MITFSFAQIYRKKLLSAHLGSRLQNDRVFNDGKTSVEELHQKVRKLSGLQTERRSKMYRTSTNSLLFGWCGWRGKEKKEEEWGGERGWVGRCGRKWRVRIRINLPVLDQDPNFVLGSESQFFIEFKTWKNLDLQ